MEDECARGEIRNYDLWLDEGKQEYIGCLMSWTVIHPILSFESEGSRRKFRALVADDDYLYLQERGKDKEPRKVLLADFLRMFPAKYTEKRVGMPRIEFHGSVGELLDSLG